MWTPWRGRLDRERLRTQLEARDRELAQAQAERDYWRDKAELLLDATLFRRGDVTTPVFRKKQSETGAPIQSTIEQVFGPLAVTEIESRAPHGRTGTG